MLADSKSLSNLMTMIEKYKHSSKAKKSKKRTISKNNQKSQSSGLKINEDWIYGIHPVMAALVNPKRNCLRIVVSNTFNKDLEKDIERICKKTQDIPDREKMNREQISSLLPLGAVHQGLALLSRPLKIVSIEEIIKETEGKNEATIIILDQATDPRNVGAVLRSAAAFGASAVILQDRNAPPLSGALTKAASGAVDRVSLVRVVNLARTISKLKSAGFWAAGLDADAKRTMDKADLSGRTLLVLGAEGAGLRKLTRDTCDVILKISIKKEVDSLNLSNAAAVALYEINRQR
jgi:23S rRNA (guanosine2251-2'-O)-methyltransferase